MLCYQKCVNEKRRGEDTNLVGSIPSLLETVQDILIKLDIKSHMHVLEISIYSLNHVIASPTKIMNNLLKDCKICTFKVIFQLQKLTESFSVKIIRLGYQPLTMKL